MPKKIFLNFDFYGSGNIGDDLMLDGFLKGLGNFSSELYCCTAKDNNSQRLRFPKIKFLTRSMRKETAESCSIWTGVGDTPIQIKSGEWFLTKLMRDIELKANKKINYYFLGVGAEKEATSFSKEFNSVLSELDFIWTRDQETTDLLKNEFGVRNDMISTSSDLANISLKIITDSQKAGTKKFALGLCYYDEETKDEDLKEIKRFIKNIDKGKVLLFANDVNMKGSFENGLYSKMFSKAGKFLNNNIQFYTPEYFEEPEISKLVSHYAECETVMSSRYHVLLTAAWFGCRIVSLERSSKVTALASELGIEQVDKPFTADKLSRAFENAKPVDKNILQNLFNNAQRSVDEYKQITSID